MKRFARFAFITLLAAACALLVVACDDVVKDATFREWCGETLCAWKLDTGSIKKAPTWHKNDYGVEFVSTPTAISQVVLDKSPRCLTFTTIADVDPSAQMTIGVDFNDDGTIDVEQPVAAVAFREAKTQVTAPIRYSGLRFVISKKGNGRAVLAQMRVQSGEKCSAPPVELHDQELGAPCSVSAPHDCVSGVCCEGICAECCQAPKGLDVGGDGGVATPPEVLCPNGGTCERRDVKALELFFRAVPLQCDPGKGLRTAGALCLANDDCASGVCEGAEARSVKAARFPTSDAGVESCPAAFPDAGGDDCAFTAVRGGRCR